MCMEILKNRIPPCFLYDYYYLLWLMIILCSYYCAFLIGIAVIVIVCSQ
jgi:hypothetical protein